MPLLHQSITEVLEPALVSKVMSDPHYRSTLLRIKGLLEGDTKAAVREGVQLREYKPELVGDIDILVIPYATPEEATAIQVKRFEVQIDVDGDDLQLTRTAKLFRHGVRQANYAARVIGFHQVYLWVFVVVDSRKQNDGRYTYDGPDGDLSSRIDRAISPVDLDPRVGLIKWDWVQPIDRAPLEFGTHGGSLSRLAQGAAQPAELTEWLKTLC
jgi:hypothetical protein